MTAQAEQEELAAARGAVSDFSRMLPGLLSAVETKLSKSLDVGDEQQPAEHGAARNACIRGVADILADLHGEPGLLPRCTDVPTLVRACVLAVGRALFQGRCCLAYGGSDLVLLRRANNAMRQHPTAGQASAAISAMRRYLINEVAGKSTHVALTGAVQANNLATALAPLITALAGSGGGGSSNSSARQRSSQLKRPAILDEPCWEFERCLKADAKARHCNRSKCNRRPCNAVGKDSGTCGYDVEACIRDARAKIARRSE